MQRDAGSFVVEQGAQPIEVGDGDILFGKLGRDLPGIGTAELFEPLPDSLFAGDVGEGVRFLALTGER